MGCPAINGTVGKNGFYSCHRYSVGKSILEIIIVYYLFYFCSSEPFKRYVTHPRGYGAKCDSPIIVVLQDDKKT